MSLRTILTDNTWNCLFNLLERTGRVYNKPEHRNTIEGILYRIRTGCPWRDLPSEFGRWNTIFRRFNLWSKKGIIQEALTFLGNTLIMNGFFEVRDSKMAPELVALLPDAETIKADRGHDSEYLRELIQAVTRGKSNIPHKRNSKKEMAIWIGVYIVIAIWLKMRSLA